MSLTIWKLPLQVVTHQFLSLPAGARPLAVQLQRDALQLWFLCDPEAEQQLWQIGLHGTGHPIANDPGQYIGTFQLQNGALVFHVFARPA